MRNATSTGTVWSDIIVTNKDWKERNENPRTKDKIRVEEYTGLIIRVMVSCQNKYGIWIYNYKEDLMQAGYVGLLMAKEKYVPGRGSFISLAWLRIAREMNKFLIKEAKCFKNFVSLEDATALNEEEVEGLHDTIEGDVKLDYDMIFRLVKDDLKEPLEYLIKNGNNCNRLKNHIDDLRKDLKEVVSIIYPRN